MLRHILLAAGLGLALTACASTDTYGSAMLAADGPQPEMERLAHLIGTWTGTAQILSAPEAMAAELPTTEDGQPVTMLGGWEASWALGGKFMRQAGWHERAPGVKQHYVEYVSWDEDAGKYRAWSFSDSGEAGQSSWVVSNDGKTISVSAQGRRADGTAFTGRGKMNILDDGSTRWTWSESGPQGRTEMQGTGTRQD